MLGRDRTGIGQGRPPPGERGDGTLACSDADGADLDAIIKATERYCVVFQTLNRAPNLSVSYSTS